MWDWDAEPAAEKKPASKPVGAWLGGGAGALIVALVVARLVLLAFHSGEATGHPLSLGGAVRAQQTEGPSEEQLEQAAGLLLGPGMTPANPDAQNLGPTETLVLVDHDDELHLTPGALVVRNEPCYGGPLLTIALTATATKGSPIWDATAFELLDADNRDVRLLTQCATDGELAFPATTPRWLLYTPDGGAPQARWRLS
jgi:hypothetical protein